MPRTVSPDEERLWLRLENVKLGIGGCVLTAAGSRPDGAEAARAHGQILALVEEGLAIRQELGLDPLPEPAPEPEPEPVQDWFNSRRRFEPPPPPRHRASVA